MQDAETAIDREFRAVLDAKPSPSPWCLSRSCVLAGWSVFFSPLLLVYAIDLFIGIGSFGGCATRDQAHTLSDGIELIARIRFDLARP